MEKRTVIYSLNMYMFFIFLGIGAYQGSDSFIKHFYIAERIRYNRNAKSIKKR